MSVNETTIDLNQIADQMEAAGMTHVYAEGAEAIVANLSYDQKTAVNAVLTRRRDRRDIEAFETTPAIRAYMLAALETGVRGQVNLRKVDLRWMVKASRRTTNQFGSQRPAYSPQPGCSLRLKLSEAVAFLYSQESYSDDSITLVPVLGEVPSDAAALRVCESNLSAFVRYSDTHTGMAGSGSNYTAHLVITEHGPVAAIHCRTSIAD